LKRAFYITAAIVVLCAIVGLALYSRAVHPQLLPPSRPLTHDDSTGHSREFAPSAAIVESIRGWVAAHQSGWHLSFVTYASRSHFSCDTLSVEVGDSYVVLNYARGRGSAFTEVVRELAADERSFWHDTVDAARKPNQAMQRTVGRSASPLSMTSTFNLQRRSPSGAVADLVSR
jgi:hypothetical protein